MGNIQEPAKILTEEELKAIEILYNLREEIAKVRSGSLVALVASHRSLNTRNHNLVLENDELMAENMKLKEALKKVKDHLEGVLNPRRFVILDGPGMLQTLSEALEELNHE